MPLRALFFGLLTLGWALPATAINHCLADGKPVNLDNGNSTKDLTGTVRCTDDAGRPTIEMPFVAGKKNGTEKYIFPNAQNWTDYKDGQETGCKKKYEKSVLIEDIGCGPNAREFRYYPSGKLREELWRTGPPPTRENHWNDEAVIRKRYTESGLLSEITCGRTAERWAGQPQCPAWSESKKIETFYPNGKVHRAFPFKNGLIEGVVEQFDDDGQILDRKAYVHGVLAGVTQSYASGKLASELTYHDGKKDGPEKRYFAEGQLAEIVTWQGGDPVREQGYYLNGQERVNAAADGAGQLKVKATWDTGKPLYQGVFRMPKRGRHEPFPLADDHRPFAPDADLYPWKGWSEVWRDPKPFGVHQAFFQTGTPEETDSFDADGNLTGTSLAYWENGQLHVEATYAAGQLTAKKEYDDKGVKTLDESYFADGSRKKN